MKNGFKIGGFLHFISTRFPILSLNIHEIAKRPTAVGCKLEIDADYEDFCCLDLHSETTIISRPTIKKAVPYSTIITGCISCQNEKTSVGKAVELLAQSELTLRSSIRIH